MELYLEPILETLTFALEQPEPFSFNSGFDLLELTFEQSEEETAGLISRMAAFPGFLKAALSRKYTRAEFDEFDIYGLVGKYLVGRNHPGLLGAFEAVNWDRVWEYWLLQDGFEAPILSLTKLLGRIVATNPQDPLSQSLLTEKRAQVCLKQAEKLVDQGKTSKALIFLHFIQISIEMAASEVIGRFLAEPGYRNLNRLFDLVLGMGDDANCVKALGLLESLLEFGAFYQGSARDNENWVAIELWQNADHMESLEAMITGSNRPIARTAEAIFQQFFDYEA